MGGDWLILPLAAFSRHLIHLHTPSQPAFFSVRWFDVSFFLINSTFASIIQQKHPSEGMGMGECRGKGWGGFSGGVWETTSLQHIPSCCHPWEFVSCQHLKPIDNMLSEMRGAPRWQNKIYIRKNLLSEMTLILINVVPQNGKTHLVVLWSKTWESRVKERSPGTTPEIIIRKADKIKRLPGSFSKWHKINSQISLYYECFHRYLS